MAAAPTASQLPTASLTQPAPPVDALGTLEIGLGLAVVCVVVALVLASVWYGSTLYRRRSEGRLSRDADLGPEVTGPRTGAVAAAGHAADLPAADDETGLGLIAAAAPQPFRRVRRRAESLADSRSAAGSPQQPSRARRQRSGTNRSVGRRRQASVAGASSAPSVSPTGSSRTAGFDIEPELSLDLDHLRAASDAQDASLHSGHFEEHLHRVIATPAGLPLRPAGSDLPALGGTATSQSGPLGLVVSAGRGRSRRHAPETDWAL
eukprot:TRINITY_DN37837_c0_g1_i2.p1 TRINITY_DN37837_c0_g1~~TRINITY_DN37837_c0_g1_i2.p1  ORF type:complete len:299 (+),score=5.65 TRINITY_DN37837_c0_g1_i2:106-897(+)